MPKRTNDFQQLVHMIQIAFAPMGAKVTESAMMDGMREIDVLIESQIGRYSIKIAVEAKDEKRPLDVVHIEKMIGKYHGAGSIPIDKVVVIARKGFTKKANERAKQANIELWTLDKVTQSDWTKLVPQQMAFRMQPHICRVELLPPVVRNGEKDPLVDGRFVCKCHGNDAGSPLRWAEWFLRTQVLSNGPLLQKLDAQAKQLNGQIALTVPWPILNHTLLFNGQKHLIDQLIITIQYVSVSSPVKWSSFKVSKENEPSQTVDQLEAVLGGKRMRIVFPNGPISEKIVLRVDPVADDGSNHSSNPQSGAFSFETIPAPFCPVHMPPARPIPHPIVPSQMGMRESFVSKSKMQAGRNDPCPCNSGKKFKHCCLKKKF